MNSSEIRDKMTAAKAAKDNINAQLKEARRKSSTEGIFADIRWMKQAEIEASRKSRELMMLNKMLGEAVKAEKLQERAQNLAIAAEERRAFDCLFMTQAKAFLPAALYDQIMSSTIAASNRT